MKQQQRKRRQFGEQLHILNNRGPTFVGHRPTEFQSKRHPSRAKRKAMDRKEILEEAC